MVNIQLYVEKQLCDVDKKSIFSLQKEFSDETELIVKEIEYSYTLSIPTSQRNRKIFGFKDTFDVPNKFSRVYDAELYVNEMLILRGKLKLREIDGEYFKGNLYNPALQSVSDILGDRQLNEIQPHMKPMTSLSDFSYQNECAMGYKLFPTDGYPSEYKDNHVCYPYILYSLPYNDVSKAIEKGTDKYTQDLSNHNISTDNIFPCFNPCSVLKDVFETEGYKLQGNIFSNPKFTSLYHTSNFTLDDYLNSKVVPHYLKFSSQYRNIVFSGDLQHLLTWDISPTLSRETLWSENGYNVETLRSGNNEDFNGSYYAGVDNPLQCPLSTVSIEEDDTNMMNPSEEGDSWIITIPTSGWYKIHCDGKMKYPMYGSYAHSSGLPWDNRPMAAIDYYYQEGRENIGVCIDEADCTTLKEQPFEFQIKKGYPKDHPTFYSFNGGIPCQARDYVQHKTVKLFHDDGGGHWRGVGVDANDIFFMKYGKNGKQTFAKNYSGFNTEELIMSARLGGASFGCGYEAAYYGELQRHNRFALQGELLALPRADKNLTYITTEGSNDKYYRMGERSESTLSQKGTYYVNNEDFEYATNTAQIVYRADDALTNYKSFSNFDGYNKYIFTDSGERWDTTTNYNARSFPTEDTNAKYTTNTARTTSDVSGEWNMNTVVWLEKGEMINVEVVMPWHDGGRYTCCHSEWVNRVEWINALSLSYNMEIGLVSTDSKWSPTETTKIPTFKHLNEHKPTNVNQFLPKIKCNDYLNNFLQTFNLQLTHPKKDTFSIDYSQNNDLMTNVIDLDKYGMASDAEFKVIDAPSSRQLTWKIDKSETGYADGNQSPYKTETAPWYLSGYTGGITITNETNTSGSIDKKDSSWSYNWYKTIKFIDEYGSGNKVLDVPVICDKSKWSDETSYISQQGEKLQTNKTMRFFYIRNGSSNYILFRYFVYDETMTPQALLLIPSNECPPIQSSSSSSDVMLLDYDYTNSGAKKTITSTFFNIKLQDGYEIDVPIKLPNEIYAKINAGTLVRFNDGLYKVTKISEHDVKEEEKSTITLTTLPK